MGAEAVRRWQATRTGPRLLVRSGRARRGLAPRSLLSGSRLSGWLGDERVAGQVGDGSRSRDGAPLEAATRLVLDLLHLFVVCPVQRGRQRSPSNGPGLCARARGSGSVNYTLAFLQLQCALRTSTACQQPLSCQRSFAFFERSVWLTSPSFFPPTCSFPLFRVSKMIGTFCQKNLADWVDIRLYEVHTNFPCLLFSELGSLTYLAASKFFFCHAMAHSILWIQC